MSTPYGDAEQQVRRLSRSVDEVESDLRGLREEHEQQASETSSRLDSAEYKLREQAGEIEALEQRADEADEEGKDVRTLVEDLGQRVAWLERRVRTAAGGAAVDLDATDNEIDQLVTKAAAGRAAEARLLPAADRARHHHNLVAYTEATASLEQARSAVLAASGTLARASLGSDAFTEAATAYRTATVKLRSTTAQTDRLMGAVAAARTALDRDQGFDQTLAEAAEAGQDAHDHLVRIAHARIGAAVAGTGLLPVWFTTALGPMPPRADTAGWLDAATDALVYRMLYGVRDEVLALGRIPAQATARQRADRKDAEEGLRR
ncbi:hypothetical protein ACIRPK_24205 [Kitasatospora sp. NPDC101801]|uniref:hypothetical protein n=1 Tax=Kitasatospora sp. NPDC101801 TaxID=3364103 RepID=UPI0038003C2E